MALTAEEPWAGPLNIASGAPRSVLAMASALAASMEDGALEPQVTGEFRAGDVRHVFASTERAELRLDFRAGVGFAEGVAEFAGAPLRD